jgi:Tol biopolymer transport system component
MKTKILIPTITLLIVIQINFSCRKNVSCEECKQVNRPPVAIAGTDQTIFLPINTVTLDGTASTDPDNNIAGFTWTKISGPSSSSINNSGTASTTATNLVEGVYGFELRVTDEKGLFSKDTVQITVMRQPTVCNECKIVFVSARDGNSEIYSCKADGSDITRLTYNTAEENEPVWSPDHSKIAFISNRSGVNELYVMNSNGSDIIRKTFSGAENPAWSPDGKKIAYATLSTGSQNLWVVDITNDSRKILFEAPGWDAHPAWSPDGSRIVLVSDWAAYDFVYDVYTIKADGSDFTPLTNNIFDRFDYIFPSWSPAGVKIATLIQEQTGIDQYVAQIGVMNATGGGVNPIISGAAPNTRTSWSADGARIVYTALSGSRRDVSWVYSDGSSSGTIVTNGWNADW